MERKELFNTVVQDYAQARPGYPQAMIDDLNNLAQFENKPHILEIGCGAGQATQLLLDNGFRVTAVELGKNLADHCRTRFENYPDFEIINTSFEDFNTDQCFDVIFAASSFHWVDQETAYLKSHELLNDNGYLMLCWNGKLDQSDQRPVFSEIASVYEKYAPEMKKNNHKLFQHEFRIEQIIKDKLFTYPLYLTYPYERSLNANQYLQLLNTYSDHIALDPDTKNKLFSQIKQIIMNNGDSLLLDYEVKCYISKKL
jgi:SAM-dependent methyltransferase